MMSLFIQILDLIVTKVDAYIMKHQQYVVGNALW